MSETRAGSVHVLVVDDNQDSVIIMRGMLEPRGFKVSSASTGSQALAAIKREPPDVVLLDVMMPEMSGLEVLQRLKEEYQTGKIPVILVTAKTQDDDVVKGYQFGADYYIPKPFTVKQLVYGIELVLGKGEPVA
ncbi:MAG: response regulator [Deltaproteobacteria bacterium]|nr:response regulator [Deltaproteobacteria bacterium]